MQTRGKSHTVWYVLAVLAITAMVVAGCAPAAAPAATEAPKPTQAPAQEATQAPQATAAPATNAEPIKLGILTGYGKQLQPAVEAYNADMKAQGKNIEVVMVDVGTADVPTKFAALLSAGDPPDIIDLDLVSCPKFTSMGALLDITDKVQAAGLRDDFNPKFLDLGVWDGKVYMIPFNADVSAIFYNKDLLKQAGLDPEMKIETWDDLRNVALAVTQAKLKASNGLPVYGYASASGPGSKMFCDMPFIWTNGGGSISNGEIILDSPQTIEGFQWLIDLALKDKVSPPNPVTYSWDDKMNGFYNGEICLICCSSYAIGEVKDRAPNLNYGVVLFPHPKGKGDPSSFIGGDLIGIPKGSKHPEEAWDFIQYCMTEKVQVDIWAQNGMPPVRLSMAKNKYFDAEPRYEVFSQGVRLGQVPKSEHYDELYEPWNVAWEKAYEGEPVPAALKEAAAKMREIIAK